MHGVVANAARGGQTTATGNMYKLKKFAEFFDCVVPKI